MGHGQRTRSFGSVAVTTKQCLVLLALGVPPILNLVCESS